MNLKDIYDKVCEIAVKYGFKTEWVTFQTLYSNNQLDYTCDVFDFSKHERICSELHLGYEAMLKSFEDNLKYHQLEYSKEPQMLDIE